jgi:hypothetical protein
LWLCTKAYAFHAFASSQKRRILRKGRRPAAQDSQKRRILRKGRRPAAQDSQKRLILRKGAKRPPRRIIGTSATLWHLQAAVFADPTVP